MSPFQNFYFTNTSSIFYLPHSNKSPYLLSPTIYKVTLSNKPLPTTSPLLYTTLYQFASLIHHSLLIHLSNTPLSTNSPL